MKQLVVSLLAAVCFNVLAVDAGTLLRPSPLGVVIAFNTYFKDKKKVYYIRVESQARDFESAKKQAFRLASEQVAGTVVLSESELRNSNLTRDEIITYSSGLIDEYKIVDRFDSGNSVKLTMDVWITESVMAQRLLAKSATNKGVDGSALSTRAESILTERSQGDQIIWAVLRDMPQHGFSVKLDTARVAMDANRNTVVSVTANIKWDPRYVDAFTAAAKEVGTKPDPWCWSNCSNHLYSLNGYMLPDPVKLLMVTKFVQEHKPTLRVEIQDPSGRALARTCSAVGLLQEETRSENPMIVVGAQHVALAANNTRTVSTRFFLGQNTLAMAQLNEIRAEIVTQQQCVTL